MASKNAQIEKVFNYTLNAWATAQSVSVAWDGKAYSPTVGTNYVSQIMLPSTPENISIGRDISQRRRGVYQIDVRTSTTNKKYDADQIVASLESAFKVGYALTYNSVSVQVENFYPDPLGDEDGWYRVSISIFYRSDI